MEPDLVGSFGVRRLLDGSANGSSLGMAEPERILQYGLFSLD